MDKVEVIIGLDNITDYSENLLGGKEDLYSVLPEIQGTSDVIVLFDTKDNKVALFASGNMDGEGKGFLMIISQLAINIFNFLEYKYNQLLILHESEDRDYSSELLSLNRLAIGLAHTAKLNIEEHDNTN
jgi:hypothetical protein